ncbi:MAG: hypothetical protein Q9182_006603 [Xanthomendoza sp. 2 TL-2023]
MGANQSTSGGPDPGGENRQQTKRCYYDVLDVDSQATDEEIKKAYRKKALELHPDRNYGNVDETTKQFAEVQSAYAVLSDPQERAWYDSHRNIILRGEDDGQAQPFEHDVRITRAIDIMTLLPRINACRDFSNSPSGFYTTVRDVFDTLAKEEQLACEWQDIDTFTYPGFGNADDDYNSGVRSFYAAWASFATKKTFAWMDVYRYSDAPDRRVRRLMEKENKRMREDAAREFNEAVQSLVAFVKKRDPRFKPNVQSEIERQQVLRNAATAQAARSRAANQAKVFDNVDLPQWTRSAEPEVSEGNETPEEETREVYECVVCDKTFKSEKQFGAHERSKKHMKASQQIRRKMQDENDDLHLEEEECHDEGSESRSREDNGINDVTEKFDGLSSKDTTHLNETNVENLCEQNDTLVSNGHRSASSRATSVSISDDEYGERQAIEGRILDHQKVPNEGLEYAETPDDVLDSTQGTATPGSGFTGDMPERKVGKAKAKRAKKAAQNSTESARADTQVRFNSCASHVGW